MLTNVLKNTLRRFGVDLVRYRPQPPFPPDFLPREVEIIRSVTPYTMTSAERLFALVQAVQYVLTANIPGSIVECGVWRGGSMMAAAQVLQDCQISDRDLYLFDTYEGMVEPTEVDVNLSHKIAFDEFAKRKINTASSDWCHASLDEVRENIAKTGYDLNRIHFIKGKVEDTIPQAAPDTIALLRLDTDWFESTRHELIHLYPRLVSGGVLIIDDYGHWQGARKATDEFLAAEGIHLLLNRIDYTGRICIKP
jgi:O-methyltransferase